MSNYTRTLNREDFEDEEFFDDLITNILGVPSDWSGDVASITVQVINWETKD